MYFCLIIFLFEVHLTVNFLEYYYGKNRYHQLNFKTNAKIKALKYCTDKLK